MRSDRTIRLIVPHALAIKQERLEKRGHEVAEEGMLLAPAEPKVMPVGLGGLNNRAFTAGAPGPTSEESSCSLASRWPKCGGFVVHAIVKIAE
jgi:hypothetical protein